MLDTNHMAAVLRVAESVLTLDTNHMTAELSVAEWFSCWI